MVKGVPHFFIYHSNKKDKKRKLYFKFTFPTGGALDLVPYQMTRAAVGAYATTSLHTKPFKTP